MYRIVTKEALKPTVILYEIEAPMVARKAQPGQFIILRVDENGERIPITIHDFDREKGTVTIIVQTIGATTDLDGSFSVRIGARTDVRLIVSYLGLKTREVAVDDPARFYEVRLENDNMALDEVVVVGYGTQRRSLVTNAISQFKPTEENMRSVMSPSELLQGRIAAGADIGKDAVHDILHILFGADVPVQNFFRFQFVKLVQLDHFAASCKVSRSCSSIRSTSRCLNW